MTPGLADALSAALADALTKDWPGDTRRGAAPAIVDYLLGRPDVRAALIDEDVLTDVLIDLQTGPRMWTAAAKDLAHAIVQWYPTVARRFHPTKDAG